MHSAVFFLCFISAAAFLPVSLPLTVKLSLSYNRSERAGVCHNFILVFLNVFVV